MQWVDKKIAVLGDMILDEYVDGDVTRISPEAPVPIHKADKSWVRPGGACNAAANIQTLGGQAIMLGLCGKDHTGHQLIKALADLGIDTTHIHQQSSIQTVKKTRITCRHQQLLRIDWEDPLSLTNAQQDALLTSLHQAGPDAILLSDYGKGLLTTAFLQSVIQLAKKMRIPCLVDPKGKDFSRYQGCSLITPNRSEAMHATGLTPANPEEMAHIIQKEHSIQHVMITLSAEGMILLQDDGSIYKQTPKAREVFDVSGAGDTVAAVMSLSMAAKMPLRTGMEFANLAAGLAVEKWGTQCVYLNELHSFKAHRTHHKIHNTAEGLLQHLETRRQGGQTIVMTNGCFDIMHAGHLQYLEEASTRGDHLLVAVNSDASVSALKGPERPVTPLRQRMEMLAGLACVDSVIAFEELTPESLLHMIRPDCLVKGGDYKPSEVVGAEIVADYGGKVEVLSLTPGLSTTYMIEKITENHR